MGLSVAQRKAQKVAEEQKALAEALEELAADMEKAQGAKGDWYCVRAACGQTRRAQRGLKEQKVIAYLPIEARWIKHARRKIRGSRPLLGRYLFVKLDREDEKTPGFYELGILDFVADLVGTNGVPSIIPESFVMALWEAEVAGHFDATRPTKKLGPKFDEGDHAVIKSGPLEGCSAIVSKVLSDRNVSILYTLFGRSGEATIEMANLAPLAA